MSDAAPPPGETPSADHELVVLCLDALQVGGESAVRRVLEAHPDRADWLRERLGKLAQMGLLPVVENAPEFPERLGEHRLLRRLGAGGMGVVFLAEQESLGRTVALKVLRPEQRFFPGARARFRREVELVAKLGDPGIVPIYSVGEVDGVEYFTMEYLRGASLGEAIAAFAERAPRDLRGADLAAVVAARAGEPVRAPLPELFAGSWVQVVARIVGRMARAVHHAHERGVVHRDLKPNNAMVTGDGRVLLLDFGLAAAADADRITRSGAVLGTLHYMAPEQIEGDAVDVRTDVYALGVTLHELLALRSPFQTTDTDRLRQLVLHGGAESLRRSNPDVPRDVESIARQAMDRDPRRRYPSAAALADDLERFLELRPVQARPAGAATRARRWMQRHPVWAASGGVLLVSALVGYALWGHLERRAAEQVEQAREQAHGNLRGAIVAIEQLMKSAREGPMSTTPGLDGERLRQLQQAIQMIERLRAENPEDPTVQQLFGRGMMRAAELQELLGDSAAAATALDAAEPVMVALRDAHPEHAGYRDDVVGLRVVRGSVLVGLDRLDEAQQVWRDTLADVEQHHPKPWSRELRQVVGTCHNNLGRMRHVVGDLDGAAEHLRAAIATEQGVERPTLDLRLDSARTHMNLATVMFQQQQGEQAVGLLDGVQEELAQLAQQFPKEPEIPREQARARFAAARLAMARGDEARARELRTEAIAGMQRLVDAWPARVAYRRELGVMQFDAAVVEQESRHRDAAAGLIAPAIAGHEQLAGDGAGGVEVLTELGTFLRLRAGLEAASGKIDEALATLGLAIARQQEAIVQRPRDPHHRVQLAALHQEVAAVHMHDQHWEPCRDALLQARDAYEVALAAGDRATMEPRRFPKVLMVLAQVQLMCDDFDAVMAALQRLVELQPMKRAELEKVGERLHVDDREDFAALLDAAPR
ncbi:MAG: serine/threonine protein kinase [Planctomycetes bacterium]|nr:serine/threonine protein kinase [Planctomycetota bacterium]